MAQQNFMRTESASFPRLVEENLSMLEETHEGTVLHLDTQLGSEVHAKKIIELCPSLVSSTNSNGDTPLHLPASLHCAAMEGSVENLREPLDKVPSSFNAVTVEKKETVFHIAARHKKSKAFIFMATSADLGQLLYQLDVEGNTVLHVAASVGSVALVKYITEETKIEVNAKNKKGLLAIDLLNKDDGHFLQLSAALMCGLEIKTERPPSPREMVNFENQVVADADLKLQKEMLRVRSSDTPNKKFEMQLEALQSARNTLTVVAVLIASVTFTCGVNPPGGVGQEPGPSIGKAVAGKTLAYMIFSISNSLALFTSVSMVVLLVSVIPYREDSLLKFLIVAHRMMWVALAAMASAYVSAASVTLPDLRETEWLLFAILGIASLTLGGMFVYLRFELAKCVLRKVKLLECLSSPPVRKNGRLDMAANIIKGYYSY